MITEIVRVTIDGKDQGDLAPDVIACEVSEDVAAADVFALRLAVVPGPGGRWPYVEEKRFLPWRRVTVEAGYPGAVARLFDGFVTHTEVRLSGDGESYLEVSGMDGSAAMDLGDQQRAWPNKKDSEIAETVFKIYDLDPDVQDTVDRPPDRLTTVLQSESDIRFLRRLAARNGMECRVVGGVGRFRAPNLRDAPQKALRLSGGAEGTLVEATIRVDGRPAGRAEMRRIDPVEKRTDVRKQLVPPARRLGQVTLDPLRRELKLGHALLSRQSAATVAEMEARLRAAADAAGRFVRLTGEIDSRAYRSVLRAGRLVEVGGLGAVHTGLYYVVRVHHSFTAEGYVQRFEADRNAIGGRV